MPRKPLVLVLLVVSLVSSGWAQLPPPVAPVGPDLPPFDRWLEDVRQEALTRGIRPEVIAEAFAAVEAPVRTVLERDRTQAEFTLDLDAYLKRRLTRSTVRMARQMFSRHRRVLTRVGNEYGVDPRILVSVWGLESNFGRFAGVRPTIPALATLAYDPRRGTMFRNELLNALEIVNRGDVELSKLKGSWAGALGQPQFMPSSYLEYAQDFDGDGRRDIWTSLPDVFASIAFYLRQHGWTPGYRWGREVRISKALGERLEDLPRREEGCRAARLLTEAKPLAEWNALGVRTTSGARLPKAEITASVLQAGTRSFLVYDNYLALLGYNCAHSYALSVGLLATQ